MLRSTPAKAALGLAAGLMVLAAFAWPHLAASRVHEDPGPKLRQLQQLDMVLTQDMLKVALGLLSHYDTLDRTSRDIEDLAGDLARSLETSEDVAELRRTIEAYRALHAKRADGIERFKSSVARLRNSAQLFPRVVEAFFAERLTGQNDSDKLAVELKLLLTDVLIHQSSQDGKRTEELQRRIRALSAQSYKGRQLIDPEFLIVTKHADVIVSERASVDGLVRKWASSQGVSLLRGQDAMR